MRDTTRSRSGRRSVAAMLACGAAVAMVPVAIAAPAAHADAGDLIISEVWPGGSGNGTYAADWFEVTNTGPDPVDISGWRVDDSSNAWATGVALTGVSSIAPGQSVVFVEGNAATASALTTAWFGASVPAGFTIGTYSGSGIGLSGSGDAVNLFDDTTQSQVTGVTFGAAGSATTFDNAAGLSGAISTLSAVGVNGAFTSADGAEVGSPGTIGTPAPPAGPTAVDLSTYVRVGRYDLPEPLTTTPPDSTSLLAQEVSAVTYNPVTDSLFVVGDGGTSVVQVSKTGQLIDSMTLAPGSSPQGTEFSDPEGITYVGGGDQFVMVEERDRRVSLFTYVPGTTLERADVQSVTLGTYQDNIGIEGLTYDPLTAGFVAVKEISPLGIFQTGVDFAAGTATNGSPSTVNPVDLFDPALLGMSDFADVYALSNLPSLAGEPQEEDLLVLSQEDGRIVVTDRTGAVSSSLTITSDPGNPLSVPNQQHEGLTMDHDGNLYVVSENGGGSIDHPQLWVYAPSSVPNAAPTAVDLTNATTALAENTSTATRLKVADVVVTDDGLGTNVLAVTGPDAASFEVDSNGLYLKAGTVLDFETKASFEVSVTVDDPSLGSTPDVTSTPFTLTVTDVEPETATVPPLVISEVSPWSSSTTNAPYGADWFEVTNLGADAVDLTGYSMDDNSNAFANAVALTGVTSIAANQSVVFVEGTASTVAAFTSAWFGASPPAGLAVGSYSGGGVGLSTGGDAVNLFDAAGNRVTGVAFGIATTGRTFDNTAGAGATALPLPVVSTLSTVGVNGAFLAADGIETGSPGSKATTLAVTEVAPWASGSSPYGADWFEITNLGLAPVDVSGWKMDDNSESPAGAVALLGVEVIAPGESVVLLEGTPAVIPNLLTAWFGATPPASLQVGTYSGSGVGLSTGGDAVNLFDATGKKMTGVSFGASTTGVTFDNSAGLRGPISTLSVAGTNGAFLAADGIETGSPGLVEAPPTIVPGSASVVEGDSGSTSLLVPVTLSAPSVRPVTVAWTTLVAAGTTLAQADPGVDYTPVSGSLTFGPGQAAATVAVPVLGDVAPEDDELLVVSFHSPSYGRIGGFLGLGFGAVVDDDQPVVVPGVATVAEGDAGTVVVEVPVTLSAPSAVPVTVEWTTLVAVGAPAGQASAGTDYLPVSGLVTFAPGQTAATAAVTVIGDVLTEGDEYVVVSFRNPTGAKLGGFWGLGFASIADDD